MDSKEKKILYLQYTNPAAFPPLENSAWMLAEAGWKVKFIGTKALGVDGIEFPYHENIQVELAPFCHPGLRQKLHFLYYNFRCFKEALLGGYSCIYVSDLFSCPIAWMLSSLLGLKVFYHEHDTPDAPQSRMTRILHWTRRKLAGSADLCIIPQKDRAKIFSEKFATAKVQVCHNMPLKNRVLEGLTQKKSDHFRLWYHGSLVPTLLPLTVLEALAILPDSVTLHFAGYELIGYPHFLESFMSKARALGVQERVFYEGALSRGVLYEKAGSCDLGLALFARQFREPMVGASNKPFDYMACGLALLINDSTEWREFFCAKGFGVSCNPESGEKIAEAVQVLIADKARLIEMQKLGKDQIRGEWNYECQFSPVMKNLEA